MTVRKPATRPQLSKSRAAELLLLAREDIAMQMANNYTQIRSLHEQAEINAELYSGLTGEDAPEIEVSPVMRRLAG